MGFRSLQHVQPRGSTVRGICLPATFRPQGLAALSTVYSPRSLAGFVSHRQRSWDFPFGAYSSRKVTGSFPPGSTHVPFLPTLFPSAEAEGRPVEPRFLGFDPCRSPLTIGRGLKAPITGCSLGFNPLEVSGWKPWPEFRPASSRVLAVDKGLSTRVLAAPRSLDQFPPRLAHFPRERARATSSGFSCLHVHRHLDGPPSGL
jgi:hypothetical protein